MDARKFSIEDRRELPANFETITKYHSHAGIDPTLLTLPHAGTYEGPAHCSLLQHLILNHTPKITTSLTVTWGSMAFYLPLVPVGSSSCCHTKAFLLFTGSTLG